METLDKNIKLAHDLVKFTNKTVFLTGKAGTGKTTFLRNLRNFTKKRMVIVAPTGVAALNAGGVTIHSFFQLPFTPFIPEGAELAFVSKDAEGKTIREQYRMNTHKIKILRSLDLLVIDEISMVRSDLLDAIDDVLRHYRRSSLPFGGVQLLMIGDLYQLTPVVKDEEWQIVRNFYRSPYFFDSNALKKLDYVTVELTHIFRQQDEEFISVLNEIRNNSLSQKSLEILNLRVGDNDENAEGCIRLTTHNVDANSVNTTKLDALEGKEFHYSAVIKDNFPSYMYPTDENLVLKEGAQVMFIKNDSSMEKLYYNGKIGRVVEIDDEKIMVLCKGDYVPIEVKSEVWENIQYLVNEETKEIEQKVIGEFRQYPLRLAWAITIHKSQGLSFEKAIIDVHSAFAFGQVYVALSRCKSLQGLTLKTPIANYMIKSDTQVTTFCNNARQKQPSENQLNTYVIAYQREIILKVFSFDLLQRLLNDVRRVYMANFGRFNPEYSETILKIIQQFDEQMFEVNKKFVAQLSQIFSKSPEIGLKDDEFLQERISKASEYYFSKIVDIIGKPFSEMLLESDNKEIDDEMKTALEKVEIEYLKKLNLFDKMRDGFSTEMYIRIISDVENSFRLTFGGKSKSAKTYTGTGATKDLFYALNQWRKSVADEFDIPIYYVLPQKSLIELVEKLPQDAKSLSKIKGIGTQKIKQFGNEILNIISDFCRANGIETQSEFEIESECKKKSKKESVQKEKIKKGATNNITLEMYRNGQSIDEIATQRNLQPATITSHLIKFIPTGEVQPEELIDKEKFAEVMSFLEGKNVFETKLTDLFNEGDGNYSYVELKIGIAFMEKMKNEA